MSVSNCDYVIKVIYHQFNLSSVPPDRNNRDMMGPLCLWAQTRPIPTLQNKSHEWSFAVVLFMFALLGLWRAPLAKSLQLMSWGYIDQTHTETVSKVLIAHHGLEFTWMGLRDVLISRRRLMSNFKKRLTEAKFQFFEEVKDSGWTINDFTLLHYFSICVEYWCYRMCPYEITTVLTQTLICYTRMRVCTMQYLPVVQK